MSGKRKADEGSALTPELNTEGVKAWLAAQGVLDEDQLKISLAAIDEQSIDGEALLSMSEAEIGRWHFSWASEGGA